MPAIFQDIPAWLFAAAAVFAGLAAALLGGLLVRRLYYKLTDAAKLE